MKSKILSVILISVCAFGSEMLAAVSPSQTRATASTSGDAAVTGTVTLAWDDPSSPDAQILHYTVYEKVGATYQPVGSASVPSTQTTLTDVSFGPHTYVVTAVNFAGESDYSAECAVVVDITFFRPAALSTWSQASIPVGASWWYLDLPGTGVPFGFYSTGPTDGSWADLIYHNDLGFLYCVDAHDGAAGVYFYDFASGSWFYTSPSYPFPYLWDFGLNTVLYYFPDSGNPGRYTTNPRYFFNFATGQIITK